jgi:hypothetical protein
MFGQDANRQEGWDRAQNLPLVGLVVALAYGLSGEWFFKQMSGNDWLMGTLSLSFLMLLPVGIGALTARLSPRQQRLSWAYTIFVPWAVCGVLGVLVLVLAWEAAICVAMGLPIFFVFSSIGGAAMCWFYNRRQQSNDTPLLGLLVLTPLLFSPLEAQWQPPTVIREIKTAVVVDVPAEVIWNEFVSVPKIQREEERFAWFRAAGLPHPVEATLVNPGPEGVRYASYDNGMRVIEAVQVWELYDRYRFGVALDAESGQHTPLWSDVAGEHLHVQWVEYDIEPLSAQQVRLHLTSRYALETPINPYATAWVDFLLRDFQHYILDVVTHRAVTEAHGRISQLECETYRIRLDQC